MQVTGADIHDIRVGLSFTQPQLASLLGVSPSTVSRWERDFDAVLRMEPMQLQLVLALKQEMAKRQATQLNAFAQGVGTALIVGGGLFGLYKLLEAVFDDD